MAVNGAKGLREAMRTLSLGSTCRARLARTAPSQRIILPSSRPLATEAPEAPLPSTSSLTEGTPVWNSMTTVPVTIHTFPALEPVSVTDFPVKHLYLPLRRDLLHRAIIFEGDNTRQGTASSKNKWEVHGSHRKQRPQKGTGHARIGWKQSPLQRGGGKSFGPRPRDFGTGLPQKIYDKAWRTALSWRYRRGELIVCEDGMELPLSDDFFTLVKAEYIKGELRDGYMRKQAVQLMAAHGWGKEYRRTLFVTAEKRNILYEAVFNAGDHGRALEVSDVDLKDLLEDGRIVVERAALKEMLDSHQSDLVSKFAMSGVTMPESVEAEAASS